MNKDYKNAMDRVQADDEFKARVLQRLEAERMAPTVPEKKSVFIRYAPLLSSIAAALILTLAVFASRSFILPLLNFDVEVAKSDKNPVSDHFDTEQYETGSTQNTTASDTDDSLTNMVADSALDSDTVNPSQQNEDADSFEVATQPNNNFAVDKTEDYCIVSYTKADDVPIKGLSTAYETVEYDLTLRFSFDGFDKYGIRLISNDIVFKKKLPVDYTLSDFFSDHYNIIINKSGELEMYNGLFESFFDINASEEQPIDVFVNGIEILNLDNVLMSDFKDLNNVYFVVCVA